MQRENRNLPTRVLRKGTRINLYFGDTVIPGILNDSETARALIARLPLKQRMTRYRHDFCGVMEQPLPYREEEVHYGWLNGDIDFARDGNYFTILFDDETPFGTIWPSDQHRSVGLSFIENRGTARQFRCSH